MKALVTGANGFLGRHVVAALLSRGVAVRAQARPGAPLDGLGWPPSVETFHADLHAPGDLAPAFEGVDVLVHLAATVSEVEGLRFEDTVTGTERLLEAMARSGCRRIVLASSFAVYDWSAIREALDEDSPLEPPEGLQERDGYAISKSAQERVTRQAAERQGWDLTVLRPGFLWGSDRAYVAALGPRLGRVHLAIAPGSRIPLIHVENCADLVAVAATDPRARGQTFNVTDDDGTSTWRHLGDFLEGTGERGVRIPVPYGLALAAVRLAYAALRRRRGRLPHILVPPRFEARLKPLRFRTSRAREVLGWRPPLDRAACLARTYGSPRR